MYVMYMNICTYLRMYVGMYYVYIICVRVAMYVYNVYVCLYVRTYVLLYIMYVCMYVFTYLSMYESMCVSLMNL